MTVLILFELAVKELDNKTITYLAGVLLYHKSRSNCALTIGTVISVV